MTSLPAHRRDFGRQMNADDELTLGSEIVLPDLPTPGPAAREILAMFESAGPEIAILVDPAFRLH